MDKMPLDALNFANISETELKNFNESARVFPTEFRFLERLLVSYKLFLTSVTNHKQEYLPVLPMYFICFRAYLIATQLIGQAHISEGLSLISRASEAVGYAVVMKEDPSKGKIWLEKSGTKEFKALFGQPFPPGHSLLHPTIFSIYNITRDHGSHANFGSIIHFMSNTAPNQYTFVYSDTDDPEWIKRALFISLHSFSEFLKVFKVLFGSELDPKWQEEFDSFYEEWSKYRESNRELFHIN